MKKQLPVYAAAMLAIVITALSCSTKPALAAETGEKRITVSGTGTIYQTPDTAKISLGVSTTGVNADQARDENAKAMEKIREKLKELGIPDASIVTDSYQIYPRYNETESITGYQARNMITITVSDIDAAPRIMDAAISAGANENRGITYSLSQSSAYYADALKLALKNAEQTAQAISSEIGAPLGQIVSVTEDSRGYAYESASKFRSSVAMDAGAGSYATEISYDQIEISAQVTVEYRF